MRGLGLLAGMLVCNPAAPERAPAEQADGHAPMEAPHAKATGPRVRVLGVAQDGGVPHAGCECERCAVAVDDPARASGATSLAVIMPGDDPVLVEATPDLPAQVRALRDVRDGARGTTDRAPIAGVVLTHAHIGHYTGLMHLGFEVLSTDGIPVWASPAMTSFLSAHAPWSQLVEKRNIVLHPTTPTQRVELGPSVLATPTPVPHRDEFADTMAWRFEGPNATVLFIPDTDPWHRWEDPSAIERLFAGVDVAFVDGTFFSGDELPGRDLEAIGHPLIVDSMRRLETFRAQGTRVIFIHLNHSNPALEPDSAATRAIVDAGYEVARVGDEVAL